MIDALIEKISERKNPSVVGIDTAFDYLPEEMAKHCKNLEDAGKAIEDFNCTVIDSVCGAVPAVKVQIAYYEMYGLAGMKAFCETLKYAKSKGLIVITDAKRNDIGSTAACYSKAFLSGVEIGGKRFLAFPSDFLTVNGYLGTDGISPFLEDCRAQKKGLFILVKTSNPSGGELQNRRLEGGDTIYSAMGKFVEKWGADLIGKYGYSEIGAVVGATHPKEAADLRAAHPSMFFLVPGYGAQGGKAEDLTVCFDKQGRGAIVNSSRGILCAYKSEKYRGMNYGRAALAACEDMREDIAAALLASGKNI